VITHTHDVRIYSRNIIKNTLHAREPKNHRTPQQPIFTETRFLKQSHTSLLNKDANAKTSILTEKYNTWNKSTISRKLLKMDVLTFETCWAVNGEIIKRVTSSWSIFIEFPNYHRRNLAINIGGGKNRPWGFFPHDATAPHYRGFTITLRHATLGRDPLDEWTAPTQKPLLDNKQHPQESDIHVHQRDSNPQSQRARSRRPTPQIAWRRRSTDYGY